LIIIKAGLPVIDCWSL